MTNASRRSSAIDVHPLVSREHPRPLIDLRLAGLHPEPPTEPPFELLRRQASAYLAGGEDADAAATWLFGATKREDHSFSTTCATLGFDPTNARREILAMATDNSRFDVLRFVRAARSHPAQPTAARAAAVKRVRTARRPVVHRVIDRIATAARPAALAASFIAALIQFSPQ